MLSMVLNKEAVYCHASGNASYLHPIHLFEARACYALAIWLGSHPHKYWQIISRHALRQKLIRFACHSGRVAAAVLGRSIL